VSRVMFSVFLDMDSECLMLSVFYDDFSK